MPPTNAFCINCNILIKPQSVDAFCTKNFSLMQNASTLPTHFVTKKSKCTNCNIDAKCVVSGHEENVAMNDLLVDPFLKTDIGM